MCEEIEAEIILLNKTIEIEDERALDLSNRDPDKSDLTIIHAKRAISRLEKAAPELVKRIQAIDTAEYRKAWDAEREELTAEQAELADELKVTYRPFLNKLIMTFARIDINRAKIASLYGRAPRDEGRRDLDAMLAGTTTRLPADAELVARGLSFYDAMHVPLRDNLRFPNWDISCDIAFPFDPMAELNRITALNNAALIHRLELKSAGQYGPDWFTANQQKDDERRAEMAKNEEAEKVQKAEERAAFNKSLLEAEARRRMKTGLMKWKSYSWTPESSGQAKVCRLMNPTKSHV